MGMRVVCLTSLLVLLGLGLISCGTSSGTSAGTGILYVTTQGNTSVSAWAIDLSTGAISTNNNTASTGNKATSIVFTPAGDAAFVANSQDNTVSIFTVNTDGTLATTSSAQATGTTPMGMAMDPGGKFLFVANQGSFNQIQSGSISVFSVSGSQLTEVPGSPFSTAQPADVSGSGPVSVAISPNGQYLYVANQFSNTVEAFAVDSSGALTLPGTSYPVGTAPSAVTFTPDGNFIFVANQGTNSISAFAACTNATLNCVTPDGHLTPVAGSPFAAGLGPVAMAVESDSQGEYLYVADYQSNQISQFKVGANSGVLTALSPAAISTGSNPTAVAVRPGSSTPLSTGGTTYYVFATNITAGTISSFSYDSTTGLLTQIGSGTPITTPGLPSALAVR